MNRDLQTNLIRSHAAGVGKCLSNEHVRMLLTLRINTLAKGFSGISVETLEAVIKAFNNSCLPCVPERGSLVYTKSFKHEFYIIVFTFLILIGTVGASGDLAPLSHVVLGLLGKLT